MSTPNYKSMPLDNLMEMREEIDQVIAGRIEEERRELATRMARLDRFDSARTAGNGPSRRTGPLPAKYCNPKDPRETWAGRGRLPRWMDAALKNGRKIEDFRIERVLGGKASRAR
jgi:DNA-binding protein H-NS